jgi:hypothetical protein
MCPLDLKRAIFLLTLFPSLLVPALLEAQQEVVPELRGEVRVGLQPLTEGTVILHLVSDDSSGEVDSVRVGTDGSFILPLPHVPDHASRPEIFFASVEYGGLLYFGPAVTEAIHLDSLYLIQAYDTVSVPPGGAQLPLSVRNLFLEKAKEGWTVTDVFELRNEGDRTLYSPAEGFVWRYPLPQSVTDFEVGQGDMPPDVIRFVKGHLEVYSPLPPGNRFLMVRYRLPQDDFVLPMPGTTDRMEVLVREPAPAVEFPPLSPTSPVEMEPGNAFRRFVGENLFDEEVRSVMAAEPWSLPAEWLGLFVTALLGAAGVVAYRLRGGGPSRSTASPDQEPTRAGILMSIARLDDDFEESVEKSVEGREEYLAARRRLLSNLRRLS